MTEKKPLIRLFSYIRGHIPRLIATVFIIMLIGTFEGITVIGIERIAYVFEKVGQQVQNHTRPEINLRFVLPKPSPPHIPGLDNDSAPPPSTNSFSTDVQTAIAIMDEKVSAMIGPKPEILKFSFRPVPTFNAIGKKNVISMLFIIAGFLLIVFFIKNFFWYGKDYLSQSVGHKILRTIRKQLHDKLITLPMRFFDATKTGELQSRITNDVQTVQNIIVTITNFSTNILKSLIYFGLMLSFSIELSIIAIAMALVFVPVINRFAKPLRRANQKVLENIGDVTSYLQETILGIKVLKIFNKETDEREFFHQLTYSTYARSMRTVRLNAIQQPLVQFIGEFAIVTLLALTGYLIISSDMTISRLIGFVSCVTLGFQPLQQLGKVNTALQSAGSASTRFFELMDMEPEKNVIGTPHIPETIYGHIQFENVSFSYDNQNTILSNISINANPDQIIAIVGPSGSGKTTLVNLIPRFYEISHGTITLDGCDIRSIPLTTLRKYIALVPQESILFSGSIADNIRYGKLNASEYELATAAKAANAHNFITALPNGYATEIGERGVQLSGGQQQRISIARAILKDPRILILDEATSALDTESELLVQQALNNLMQGRTTFVIAHRLSTIKHADRIIVIDDGKKVQEGTHTELLQRPGLYAELIKKQFVLNQ